MQFNGYLYGEETIHDSKVNQILYIQASIM